MLLALKAQHASAGLCLHYHNYSIWAYVHSRRSYYRRIIVHWCIDIHGLTPYKLTRPARLITQCVVHHTSRHNSAHAILRSSASSNAPCVSAPLPPSKGHRYLQCPLLARQVALAANNVARLHSLVGWCQARHAAHPSSKNPQVQHKDSGRFHCIAVQHISRTFLTLNVSPSPPHPSTRPGRPSQTHMHFVTLTTHTHLDSSPVAVPFPAGEPQHNLKLRLNDHLALSPGHTLRHKAHVS